MRAFSGGDAGSVGAARGTSCPSQEDSSIRVAERASRARGGRDAVTGHSTEEVREPAPEMAWPLEWTEQRQPLRAAFCGTSRVTLTEADSLGSALLGAREHLSTGSRKVGPSQKASRKHQVLSSPQGL